MKMEKKKGKICAKRGKIRLEGSRENHKIVRRPEGGRGRRGDFRTREVTSGLTYMQTSDQLKLVDYVAQAAGGESGIGSMYRLSEFRREKTLTDKKLAKGHSYQSCLIVPVCSGQHSTINGWNLEQTYSTMGEGGGDGDYRLCGILHLFLQLISSSAPRAEFMLKRVYTPRSNCYPVSNYCSCLEKIINVKWISLYAATQLEKTVLSPIVYKKNFQQASLLGDLHQQY